ncbi:hypothetical protein EVAR_41868_1 [Eumeta japonica]|uniref:Uncharacterized protein n=1 Tax=Eumeta variegata TaxID=151549 RepID=A0A4C1XCY7_EUMVA|nr:hypothetical protein EVAR_41868_1 [Eumeta japonica]
MKLTSKKFGVLNIAQQNFKPDHRLLLYKAQIRPHLKFCCYSSLHYITLQYITTNLLLYCRTGPVTWHDLAIVNFNIYACCLDFSGDRRLQNHARRFTSDRSEPAQPHPACR